MLLGLLDLSFCLLELPLLPLGLLALLLKAGLLAGFLGLLVLLLPLGVLFDLGLNFSVSPFLPFLLLSLSLQFFLFFLFLPLLLSLLFACVIAHGSLELPVVVHPLTIFNFPQSPLLLFLLSLAPDNRILVFLANLLVI